jgi:hypothetical protein
MLNCFLLPGTMWVCVVYHWEETDDATSCCGRTKTIVYFQYFQVRRYETITITNDPGFFNRVRAKEDWIQLRETWFSKGGGFETNVSGLSYETVANVRQYFHRPKKLQPRVFSLQKEEGDAAVSSSSDTQTYTDVRSIDSPPFQQVLGHSEGASSDATTEVEPITQEQGQIQMQMPSKQPEDIAAASSAPGLNFLVTQKSTSLGAWRRHVTLVNRTKYALKLKCKTGLNARDIMDFKIGASFSGGEFGFTFGTDTADVDTLLLAPRGERDFFSQKWYPRLNAYIEIIGAQDLAAGAVTVKSSEGAGSGAVPQRDLKVCRVGLKIYYWCRLEISEIKFA